MTTFYRMMLKINLQLHHLDHWAVTNKDNSTEHDPSYVVEVIGRSKDGPDVGTKEETITYQITAVAKVPIIKDEIGTILPLHLSLEM